MEILEHPDDGSLSVVLTGWNIVTTLLKAIIPALQPLYISLEDVTAHVNQEMEQTDLKIVISHSTVGSTRPVEVGDLGSIQFWPDLQAAMTSISQIKGTVNFVSSKLMGLKAEVTGKAAAMSGRINSVEKKTEDILALVPMLIKGGKRK